MRSTATCLAALALLAGASGCIPTFERTYGTLLGHERGGAAVSLPDGSHAVVGAKAAELLYLHVGVAGQQLALEGLGAGPGRDVALAADGSLVACGSLNGELRVTRFGDDGSVRWDRVYETGLLGGSGKSIAATAGGFVVVGSTAGGIGRSDLFAVAIDGDGEELWTRFLDLGGYEELPVAVAVAPGGDLLVVGTSGSFVDETLLIRLAPDGSERWRRALATPDGDQAGAVIADADGSAVLSGTLWLPGGGKRSYLRRVDADGVDAGLLPVGPVLESVSFPALVTRSHEGDYVVAGTELLDERNATWMARIDGDGAVAWQRELDGPVVLDLDATPDGGYLLTGYAAAGPIGAFDVGVIKTDGAGLLR